MNKIEIIKEFENIGLLKGINTKKLLNNELPDNLGDMQDRIKSISSDTRKNIWLIGQSLEKIKSNKMYKNKGYKSFTEYCENELEFTRQTAYIFMRIYKTFDFKTTSRHAYSKLNEIAKVKDEIKRNELIQRLDNENLSVKNVKSIVKEIRGVNKRDKKPNINKMCDRLKKRFQKIELKTEDEILEMINLIGFLEDFTTKYME